MSRRAVRAAESVRLGPHGRGNRSPTTADTGVSPRFVVERKTPDRCGAVVLDADLALPAAAPWSFDEPSGVPEVLDHLVVATGRAERTPLLLIQRLAVERCLDVVEQLLDRSGQVRQGDLPFLAVIPTGDGDRSRGEVAAADLNADGRAFQLPLVELEAGPVLGAIVDTETDAGRAKIGGGSGCG
jgi:hypothetical protein